MDQAQPVHDAIGDLGGDDFPAQRMGGNRIGLLFLHRRREGGHQFASHAVVAGDVALFDRILQGQLGGRKQHSQFGSGQPLAVLPTPQQLVIGGQSFNLPVKAPTFLECLDQADIACQIRRAAIFGDRQSQRLKAIILQHDRADGIGHAFQQRIALLERQATLGHLLVERDLDVNLIIRTIDARAIVDEIGVDPSAMQRKGDAPSLRRAQIGTFTDHLDAQLLCIHAQPVIGGIADIAVALRGRLYIGANAAEPEQVGRGLEDRGNQRGRLHLGIGDAQYRLDFRSQRYALERAGKYAAALRDQRLVIIVPA